MDPEGQDIYSVRVFADIAEDDANLIDDANPRDGIALFWSDTYFQPVSDSKSNYVELGNSKEHQYFSEYRNYGVWAKFDDNAIQDSSIALDGRVRRYTCGIRTAEEKLRSGYTFNINAQYLHNWNLGEFTTSQGSASARWVYPSAGPTSRSGSNLGRSKSEATPTAPDSRC